MPRVKIGPIDGDRVRRARVKIREGDARILNGRPIPEGMRARNEGPYWMGYGYSYDGWRQDDHPAHYGSTMPPGYPMDFHSQYGKPLPGPVQPPAYPWAPYPYGGYHPAQMPPWAQAQMQAAMAAGMVGGFGQPGVGRIVPDKIQIGVTPELEAKLDKLLAKLDDMGDRMKKPPTAMLVAALSALAVGAVGGSFFERWKAAAPGEQKEQLAGLADQVMALLEEKGMVAAPKKRKRISKRDE